LTLYPNGEQIRDASAGHHHEPALTDVPIEEEQLLEQAARALETASR